MLHFYSCSQKFKNLTFTSLHTMKWTLQTKDQIRFLNFPENAVSKTKLGFTEPVYQHLINQIIHHETQARKSMLT